MVKPYEILIKDGHIFILDQYSAFIYDQKTFKLLVTLCRVGEGPKEIKTFPRIELSNDKIYISDNTKTILYNKDFQYLKEFNMGKTVNRVVPVLENYIVISSQDIGKDSFTIFSLYNNNMEKIKDLVIDPIPEDVSTVLISPWPRCRNWKNNIFIAIPQKGFYIEVYNKNGILQYKIDKKIDTIKPSEKHRILVMEELLYFLGKNRFEKVRDRGHFKIPIRDPLPPINNFWVFDDRIYVKTYEITDTKEKFIIMDLKGNIIKTVFLPRTYKELLTFDKNRFYYLAESEEEGWELREVDF
jgi:hypothetical protein